MEKGSSGKPKQKKKGKAELLTNPTEGPWEDQK